MISINVIKYVILIMIMSRAVSLREIPTKDNDKNDQTDVIQKTHRLQTQSDEDVKEDLTETLIMDRKNSKNLPLTSTIRPSLNENNKAIVNDKTGLSQKSSTDEKFSGVGKIETVTELPPQSTQTSPSSPSPSSVQSSTQRKVKGKNEVFHGKMNSQKNAHGNSQSMYPFQTPPIEENLHMPLSTRKQETDLMDLIEQRVPIVATLVPSRPPRNRINLSDSKKDLSKEIASRVSFPSKNNKGDIIFPDDEDDKDETVEAQNQNINKPKISGTSTSTSGSSTTPSSSKNPSNLETTTLKTGTEGKSPVEVDNRILLEGRPQCGSGEVHTLGRCHISV